ncbi:MAG: dicarboxylate/amino acid:cation symporter [Phycisphaerales bacterium]|nr:dicarboxylate/amino acid:cation symporter [Phycisphaerales bacterium]
MTKQGVASILILVSLIVGAFVGDLLHVPDDPLTTAHWSFVFGTLVLVKPLLLVAVPLAFLAVVMGVYGVASPSRLGLVGGATILYYLITMVLAVSLGMVLVTTLEPGKSVPEAERPALLAAGEARVRGPDADPAMHLLVGPAAPSEETPSPEGAEPGVGGTFMSMLDQVVPSNLAREMSEGRTLGVILFGVLLGLALAAGGRTTRRAAEVLEALYVALLIVVRWITWAAPVGVFLLMVYAVGSIGLETLTGPLSRYLGVVVGGLAIHALVVLPLVLVLLTRRNPYRFLWRMRRALFVAFATDSSAAALPVTIENARTDGECSRRASGFVLPLGATINMDGTALYEAVAVVFLFQLYGIDLEFSHLLVVAVTATFAAIGAAGTPSAGLVMAVVVIAAVNTSLGASGAKLDLAAVGVLIGVDRLVDMCRTTVNVWGDAVGAKIISRLAPDVDDVAT